MKTFLLRVAEHKDLMLLVPVLLLFFLLYSWFAVYTLKLVQSQAGQNEDRQIIFNSPDEMASYFFITNFAKYSSLRVEEPLNGVARGIIHPRAVAVVNTTLVPVQFPGTAVLYGTLAKIFGTPSVLFFTPLIAVGGALFFYLALQNIFPRIAFLSTILLLVHPAYWYYASRGLFPNILFVALLIVSASCLIFAYSHGKWKPHILIYLLVALAGLFLGFAFTVRLSELVWVVFLFGSLLFWNRKKIHVREVLILLLAFLLGFSLLLFWNTNTYGSFFFTGYTLPQAMEQGESLLSSSTLSLGNLFSKFLMPFGFHPRLLISNIFKYGIQLFWYFSIPTILGIGYLIYEGLFIKEKRKKAFSYLVLFFGITFFLFLLYGSWEIVDNINRQSTIGTSYVRYWLPIYVLSIPFVAYAFERITHKLRFLHQSLVMFVLVLLISFLSLKTVMFSSDESLLSVGRTIEAYHRTFQRVEQNIENDAILVVDRSDKIFWPRRRVVSYLENDAIFDGVRRLVDSGYPIYYYLHTKLDEVFFRRLSEEVLPVYGLAIVEYRSFAEGDYLYKIQSAL